MKRNQIRNLCLNSTKLAILAGVYFIILSIGAYIVDQFAYYLSKSFFIANITSSAFFLIMFVFSMFIYAEIKNIQNIEKGIEREPKMRLGLIFWVFLALYLLSIILLKRGNDFSSIMLSIVVQATVAIQISFYVFLSLRFERSFNKILILIMFFSIPMVLESILDRLVFINTTFSVNEILIMLSRLLDRLLYIVVTLFFYIIYRNRVSTISASVLAIYPFISLLPYFTHQISEYENTKLLLSNFAYIILIVSLVTSAYFVHKKATKQTE